MNPAIARCGVLSPETQSGLLAKICAAGADSGCLSPQVINLFDVTTNPMTNQDYIFFNKTAEQLRRIGARGGKAFGRNHRARRALVPAQPPPPPPAARARETIAAAIASLDAQFPWLRGAEKRPQIHSLN
jgi:hypothetical protein